MDTYTRPAAVLKIVDFTNFKMKSVILRAILLLLLVSIAVAHPKPIPGKENQYSFHRSELIELSARCYQLINQKFAVY